MYSMAKTKIRMRSQRMTGARRKIIYAKLYATSLVLFDGTWTRHLDCISHDRLRFVVVVDIFYLQHMISYRKYYVIKKEALESNHTGMIFLFT